VGKVVPPKIEIDDDTKEEAMKHQVVSKETMLSVVQLHLRLWIRTKGGTLRGAKDKPAKEGAWTTALEALFVVNVQARLRVDVKALEEVKAKAEMRVPAL
jgi:hypothetical protein